MEAVKSKRRGEGKGSVRVSVREGENERQKEGRGKRSVRVAVREGGSERGKERKEV